MATPTELRRRRGRGGDNTKASSEIGKDGTPKKTEKSSTQSEAPLKSPQSPLSPTSTSDLDPNSKLPRPRAPLYVAMTLFDAFVCTVLLVVAVTVRFYKLASVQSVIFDEVHYLKFIKWTITRKYFFDVNPVFGKLALALGAWALGFDPHLRDFDVPGEELPSQAVAFAARAPAALFGSLTVPVFYRVCRLLRLSTVASVVGACFILFDSMHVIQSRIAMVDSILVFYTCLSMLFALMMWNAKNIATIRGRAVQFPDVAVVFMMLVLTGFTCGLAASVRWTAFATPLLIVVVSLFGIPPFCVQPLHILEVVILFSSIILAYFSSFVGFFLLADSTGTGDAFMSPQFQACLYGSQHYQGPAHCTLSLWKRFLELNATIFRYSKGIRGKDKWGSSWFLWIFNWRGALYYRAESNVGTPDEKISLIYVLMNPAMALLIDLLIALFVGVLFYTIRYRKSVHRTTAFIAHLRRGVVLFFGWVVSMLPTMVVYRSGPLYQYLPGLFFAQALAACGFDLIPPPGRPAAAVGMIGAMVASFAYWAPWVYATPLSDAAHAARRWLPRWD